MKTLLVLTFILITNPSFADSATARAVMYVNGHVSIVENIKIKININKSSIIKSHSIQTSPNQMLTIQYKDRSEIKSSGKNGLINTDTSNKIEIFF